jgi:hypothetical protein
MGSIPLFAVIGTRSSQLDILPEVTVSPIFQVWGGLLSPQEDLGIVLPLFQCHNNCQPDLCACERPCKMQVSHLHIVGIIEQVVSGFSNARHYYTLS